MKTIYFYILIFISVISFFVIVLYRMNQMIKPGPANYTPVPEQTITVNHDQGKG